MADRLAVSKRPSLEQGVATQRSHALLRGSLPGFRSKLHIEPVLGGQSNPTYFVSCGNRRLGWRKQPAGELLPSAHAIDRKYRMIRALAGTTVPMPPAVLFCDDRGVVRTSFYLMERVEGRVFHDGTLAGVRPDQRRAVYAAMAETLGTLHNIDVVAVGLQDFGRPGSYFACQIGRWTRPWELSRTRTEASIERVIAWLPEHIPQDDTSSLVHGDYLSS